MLDGNHDNNVFRFIHLRPGKSPEEGPEATSGAIARTREAADASSETRPTHGAGTAIAPAIPGPPALASLVAVKRELERVDLARDLILPGSDEASPGAPLLTLNSQGAARLSESTKAVLSQLGVSLTDTTFDRIVE